MTHDELLAASCRMALGALLHDLGQFAERAGLEVWTGPGVLTAHRLHLTALHPSTTESDA